MHSSSKPTVNTVVPVNNDNNYVCRICYSSDNNINGSPLISPCNCSGTLKYVHLFCLKQWLMSKVKVSNSSSGNCVKYVLNPVQCELCKTFLPDYYKVNSTLYEICEYHTTFESFISLETIISSRHHTKMIYVLKLTNDKQLSIGRDSCCDISVQDKTISRIHSYINYDGEKVFIVDAGSKFGTGVQIQQQRFVLKDNKPISVQLGRSVVTLVQRNSFLNTLCTSCCKDIENDGYYWDENKKGICFEKDYFVKVAEEGNDEKNNKGNDNKKMGELQGNGFIEIEGIQEEYEDIV